MLLETTPLRDLAIEAIATKARVGKQTIYKWWGGKSALVMEAALHSMEAVVADDSGDARRDILSFLKRSARTLHETSTGHMLKLLMAEAQNDAAFAKAFQERFLLVRREGLRVAMRRGIARGQLLEDLDVDLVIDLAFGAIWLRLLTARAPITDRFAEQIVDMLWPAMRAEGKT